MSNSLPLSEFLEAPGVFVDARSPGEFKKAHIPGARNLPLLDDEQRIQVGTLYKQEGRDQALDLGFRLVGPAFADLIKRGRELSAGQCVKVYCWRGGLRSQILSWLLHTAGLKVLLLEGGYKSFRTHALSVLEQELSLRVIGGLTGTGKTDVLHALQVNGEQVIDLEALACHRGSSYGRLGQNPAPSQEQFENLLAWHWASLDPKRPVWIEHESRMIGRCMIPVSIYRQIQSAPLYVIERSLEERLEIIARDYGHFPKTDLADATQRISKKLGGVRTTQALEAIERGCLQDWVPVVLDYYDRTYSSACKNHSGTIHSILGQGKSAAMLATKLMTGRNHPPGPEQTDGECGTGHIVHTTRLSAR